MHAKAEKPLTCACGAEFKSKAKLGRHIQKWNTKWHLRDVSLVRKS